MASDMASDDPNNEGIDFESLLELFDDGMDMYNEIMSSQSSHPKGILLTAIKVLETVTRQVSESKLFTTFKTLHDVPTSHLKLFIIPAQLGFLNLKTWDSDRKESMYIGQTYFKDFLDRARSFGLLDAQPPGVACLSDAGQVVETPTFPPAILRLSDVNTHRDAKLLRREQLLVMQKHLLDLNTKLGTLEKLRGSKEQCQLSAKGKERFRVEKKLRRSYHVTLIRWFANRAIDEVEIIEWEKLLIKYIDEMNLGPTFFQKELKSKLGELPHMKTSKPVLISNGLFLDGPVLSPLHKLMHGNFHDIVFQDPLVPYPPTPRPSTPDISPTDEGQNSAIAEEKEEMELRLKEAELKMKEAELEAQRTEEAEKSKQVGDKSKTKKKLK